MVSPMCRSDFTTPQGRNLGQTLTQFNVMVKQVLSAVGGRIGSVRLSETPAHEPRVEVCNVFHLRILYQSGYPASSTFLLFFYFIIDPITKASCVEVVV